MKFYRNIGLITIMIFSFFYAEKISSFTLENNPIYKSIDSNKDNYLISYVNAVIDNNSIIPGLNGLEVNVKKSYYKMKKVDVFNDLYLVYNKIVPEISLNNNKDKIITRGNSLKNSVALVVDNNEIANYLSSNNINASVLVNINNYNKYNNLELINNDFNNYAKLETLLNKIHNNANICYLNNSNIDLCKTSKKYIVKSDIVVNNQTFINIKSNITSGDIYYIGSNLSISNFELLLKSIRFKDLHIVYLSKLISEERD